MGAELRLRKSALLGRIQVLDEASDTVGLSVEEWLQRYALEKSLTDIYKGEEIF